MRYTLDSSFLTGCELVDSQHGQLFDAINALVDTCGKSKSAEELQKSLNFLSDYTVKHFFEEEQILKKYGFSGFAGHHQYHEAFKKVVKDLSHEFILKGASRELVQDIEKKIGSWLVEHIKGQDFLWARELKDKAPELFTSAAKTAPQAAAPSSSVSKTVPLSASNAGVNGHYVMDSSFLTGCDPVDSQHGQLFEAINGLLDACKNGADREGLKKSLDFLSDYTVKHFFDEEQILKKYGFSSLAGHHQYHEAFKKVVKDLSHEFILKGASGGLVQDIKKKIGSWLIEHIKGQDFLWAKELEEKAPDLFKRTFKAPPPAVPKADSAPRPAPEKTPSTASLPAHHDSSPHSKKVKTGILAKVTLFFSLSLFIAIAVIAVLGIYITRELPRSNAITITGIASAALFLLLSACNFALLKRVIINPMRKISGVLTHVEDGDISRQIKLRSGGEIGEIAGRFDRTLENLKNLVMIIQNEAEAVDDIGGELSANINKTTEAMSEINAAVEQVRKQIAAQTGSVSASNAAVNSIIESIYRLNDEIEIQSESVSLSSSAIEHMLANIDSVTKISRVNSSNVQRLARASEVSRAGLQAMAADMGEIARESEGLLEINAVLENIAGQTNLLSMNAAIEAAHAGESGKGFAVVAGEIRKLAENSSRQSKTISEVLKKIRDMITKISGATGGVLETFTTIDADVKTVANQEEQIRNVMEEQNSGSRQILESAGRLNEITKTIKNSSVMMQEKSQAIIAEGKNLERVTAEITSGMNEMASRAGDANDSVTRISALSRRNKNNIGVLKEAISRFTVSDRHYLWDSSLLIGVKNVDKQHMELFDALNGLIDAIEAGHGKEELEKALDFLASYTATHFSEEEALQKRCGFPGYEDHRRIHEQFKETAAALIKEFAETGNTEKLVREVKRKFGDWLITHIKVQDSCIGAHIRKTGFRLD